MPEGRIAVGAVTPALLAQATKHRLNLRFQADPANTQNVAIKHDRTLQMTGINAGLIMTPGTIISLNYKEDFDINDAWHGIATSGTQYIIVNIRGGPAPK